MAKFTITSPEGQKFIVSAPDGASQEDVLSYAQAQFGKAPSAPNMNSPAFQEKVATQEAADRERYNPTSGMSPFERFRAGMGQGINSAVNGVGNLVGLVSDAQVDETKKLDAPLAATTGGKVGNFAGMATVLAPTAMIPGANTALGAGLIGGISNALTTPGGFADRALAGVYGAAGGTAAQFAPAILGAVKAAAEPLTEAGKKMIIGRVMNRAAGDGSGAAMGKMLAARELVPGSAPTAAEVAESGGIAALQRAMSAADPEAYAHRGMQQAAARTDALRVVAGDSGTMAAAEAARKAASDPLYKAAKSAVVSGDAELGSLLNRPTMKEAWAHAQQLAADYGEKITLAATPARTVASVNASGAPILQDLPAQAQQFSGKGLHYLKLALDDMLDTSPTTALGRNSKASIMELKNNLVTWLDSNIPAYGQASKAFAAGSKPINQMQIGQELMDRISPALADHGALATETAAKYAAALRNGEQTAKAATGFKQGLDGVMTPQQMDIINSVAQDLARKANSQNLGRGVGSNTFQNFAMDNLSASMGMPSAVKAALGVLPGMSATGTLVAKGTGALGKMAYTSADQAMRAKMAQALLNPQEAASLMQAAAKPGMLAEALARLPQGVRNVLPPEDILRLLQAAPGVVGASAGALPAR